MTQRRAGDPHVPVPRRLSGQAPHDDTKGLGWLVLLPVACCGGPLLIGAIATAGVAAGAGLGAAVVAAALVTLVVVVRRRRAANCCPPASAGSVAGPARRDVKRSSA